MNRSITLNLPGIELARPRDGHLISFNIPMAQVVGGPWWNAYTPSQVAGASEVPQGDAATAREASPEALANPLDSLRAAALTREMPALDLANPQLRERAAALGPSWIRVSGALANGTYYDHSGSTHGVPPRGYRTVLGRAQWEGLLDFVSAVGGRLLTSFALVPGLGNAACRALGGTGAWDPAQIRRLLNASLHHGVPVQAVELAHEPNLLLLGAKGYGPKAYAQDLDAFYRFIRVEFPQMKIVGPGVGLEPMPRGLADAGDDTGLFGADGVPEVEPAEGPQPDAGAGDQGGASTETAASPDADRDGRAAEVESPASPSDQAEATIDGPAAPPSAPEDAAPQPSLFDEAPSPEPAPQAARAIPRALDRAGTRIELAGQLARLASERPEAYSYQSYLGFSSRGTLLGPVPTPASALSDEALDAMELALRHHTAIRDAWNPTAPIWVTEAADARCGGTPWSGTFLDVPRLADELARFHALADGIAFRAALARGSYGLLDEETLAPRPAWWLCLLMRQLAGDEAFPTHAATTEPITPSGTHAYVRLRGDGQLGFCHIVVNNAADATLSVAVPAPISRFTLTAAGAPEIGPVELAQLRVEGVSLNGLPLALAPQGQPPNLVPLGVREEPGIVELPAASVNFLLT